MASKAYECWNEYWADVESNEDYSALTFYHGTSDALDISCILPAAETGFLREDWRKKLTDKVFLTDSLYSAQKYAKKACSKFGGNPVVYVVRPIGGLWQTNKNEFIADWAEITSIVSKNDY